MEWTKKDKQYIWHPFTQMKTAAPHLCIVRGEGAMIYDEQGRGYIDAVSSWWVNLHGHAHPYIAQRIYEQLTCLEHVIFAGFTHPPAVELIERLLHYLPHQAKAFFSDNGSTAVEVAIKMCIQYHWNLGQHKRIIVAFEGAYHGDTFGAMSAGDHRGFNAPFEDFLFEIQRIPPPTPGREQESADALRQIVETDEVCCFIFEPLVQGSAGMVMHSPEALDELLGICKKQQVLCIADEVMVGFFRTGKMFASDYLQHKPDLTCLSKGLTGGTLPLSLTLCTNDIYNAFLSDDKSKTFFHGHSFTGNPVGCAAALASLDLLEKSDCQSNIQRIVQRHSAFLLNIENHPSVADARQQGTILAIEFKTDGATSYFNNIRDQLYDFFMERRVLLRPLGNVIYILAPYCITDEQLDKVYGHIEEALDFFGSKNP